MRPPKIYPIDLSHQAAWARFAVRDAWVARRYARLAKTDKDREFWLGMMRAARSRAQFLKSNVERG